MLKSLKIKNCSASYHIVEVLQDILDPHFWANKNQMNTDYTEPRKWLSDLDTTPKMQYPL